MPMFRNKPKKILYLMRHAKSAWDNPEVSDHDRTLMEKGIKKTELIAGYLIKKNVKPDLIISSSAIRASETARIIAAKLGYPESEIKYEDNLYEASEDDVFDTVFTVPDTIKSVMLVGHNPTFTNFANYFLKNEIDWMPTSAVVAIEFKTGKWDKITDAKNNKKFYVYPSLLKH